MVLFMMTRVLLTFLVGLLVSMGALVSGGSGVAMAGNWSTTNNKKQSVNVAFFLEWATPNQIAKVENIKISCKPENLPYT